jgi:hypothetical protein
MAMLLFWTLYYDYMPLILLWLMIFFVHVMMPQPEVMAYADKIRLSPHVIEKDYALG